MMLASVPDVALKGRNVLQIRDLSPLEIGTVLGLATHLKSGRMADQLPLLRGKTLGMLFEKPSLRTRVSFEVGHDAARRSRIDRERFRFYGRLA